MRDTTESERVELTPTPEHAEPAQADAPDQPREWVSPGVSPRKRLLTSLSVLAAALVFFTIALTQGASMLVSTIIGIVFIGCFVWYLRIVAPEPFTIRLDAGGVTRVDRGGEAVTIAWPSIAKIKEEQFKNGTSVSLTLYKRVGERGLHRAWVAYRDDLPRFDELVVALRADLPAGGAWVSETVHD
jgi:hypothetical protein